MEATTRVEPPTGPGGAGPPGGSATTGALGPGAILAAAGVLVATAVIAINTRMDDEWGTGIFLVLNAAACAAVLGAGLQAAAGEERPTGAATALLVAGQFLLILAIIRFADVLGAEGGSGSLTWTSLLFAAIVAYPAWMLRSPISVLFSELALGLAFLAFVDWVFDYESLGTFRWLLLVLAIAYAAIVPIAASTSERHGVQLVNAAGVSVLALALTLFIGAVLAQFAGLFSPFGVESGIGGSPAGWELLAMLGCAGLIGYAVVQREPGPGYLGAIALLITVTTAASPEEEASLVGWPLVLILLAVASVAAAVAMRE